MPWPDFSMLQELQPSVEREEESGSEKNRHNYRLATCIDVRP